MSYWDGAAWAPESTAAGRRRQGPRRSAQGLTVLATAAAVMIVGVAVQSGWTRAGGPQSGGPAGPAIVAAAGSTSSRPLATAPPTAATPAALTVTPSPAPRRIAPSKTATPSGTPRIATPQPTAAPPGLLFGLGPEGDGAMKTPLVSDAPVHLLTSWYNGPGDLGWMTSWRTSVVPQAYARGYALHLIVYSGQPHETIQTRYGQACGEAYPLSDRFPADMEALARTFAGSGQLYVTLFTEFQTYACTNNAWDPNPETNAYWRALKDAYMSALGIFHRDAPNARVSLGWGGWQTRWDDPAIGGGRSMFGYFADVMRASDFQSFQGMQNDSNVNDVLAMTRTLGAYGPVMLAHYKPDNGSQAVFDADTRAMLTDDFLRQAVGAGLFAWSFMDDTNMPAGTATYARIEAAIRRYGR